MDLRFCRMDSNSRTDVLRSKTTFSFLFSLFSLHWKKSRRGNGEKSEERREKSEENKKKKPLTRLFLFGSSRAFRFFYKKRPFLLVFARFSAFSYHIFRFYHTAYLDFSIKVHFGNHCVCATQLIHCTLGMQRAQNTCLAFKIDKSSELFSYCSYNA